MRTQFDCFIIFAEMRTGSNFLESNLDLFPGLKCYGEAFNPYFMVSPKMKQLFGVSVAERDKDPVRLLERMKEHAPGLPGFRFFHDHDPRVFDALIDDPRCAKIVLTRNLLESYVSRKIAWETNQWQLNNVDDAIKIKARFVPEEFEKLFYRMKAFQLRIKDHLQRTGQTAFYLDYEDAQKIEVVNGLAKFLGEDTEITEFAGTFKKQNPESLEDKVENFEKMKETIARIDVFDLQKIPNFEPERPAGVSNYVASEAQPLVFMPIKGTPSLQIVSTLESLGPLMQDFTQKTLRQWKRRHKNHRTFTVISHPLVRLHRVFCRHFVTHGPETLWDTKEALRQHYGVSLPEAAPGDDWDINAHRTAFIEFIKFVRRNLNGQTSLPVDPAWATLSATMSGFARFALPDHVLREDDLETTFPMLFAEVGASVAPPLPKLDEDVPFALVDVYTEQIDRLTQKTYQRDFMMFGFAPWGKGA